MKQILLLPILILLFLIPCLAQSNSLKTSPQAQKFDEFVFDDEDDNYKERIARFAEALSKEPTSKAYIIAYSSRVLRHGELHAGYSLYYTQNHLENRNFNISANRIVTIRGGLRDELDVELFIVPKGAQPPKPTPTYEPSKRVNCPRLGYTSAPEYVFENTNSPLIFTTSVSSDTPEIKPIYKWSVSAGRIISGQGTPSITVERPSPAYEAVTATIEIGGYSNECKIEKDSATSAENLSSLPMKIAEFEEFTCEEELARLDRLLIVLREDPLLHGYIVVYGGKQGRHNEAKARATSMKAHLTQSRRLPLNRVTALDGDFREKFSAELWVTKQGQSPPPLTPTLDKKNVKLKGWAKIYNSPCM